MFKAIPISEQQTIYYSDVKYSRNDNLFFKLKKRGINLTELKSISNHKRRTEWLSIREIITEIMPLGEDICYDEQRKPHFKNSNFHLSISHSFERVAVGVSKKESIGIDVQRISNKISRIKNRFLNEHEQKIVPDSVEVLTAYWSMKEALFKIYGVNDVFLKQNFEIKNFDYQNNVGKAIGITSTSEFYSEHNMEFQKLDDYMVAYNVIH